MNIAEKRVHFATKVAPSLSAKLGKKLQHFNPSSRLSSRFVFMENEDRLVVLAGAQEKQTDLDKALAFGLAWLGDRDLVVVLPEHGDSPSVQRSAFFSRNIRIFTHDDTTLTEAPPLTQGEVFALYKDPLETSVPNLKDREIWVAKLLKWANSHPDLRTAHRPSYLAWHCLGRLVLRIRRVRDGLEISSGVHAGVPSEKYAPQITKVIKSTLGATDDKQLRAAASEAIQRRMNGHDLGHLEHFLQARLFDHAAMIGLKPGSVRREFPCMRPGSSHKPRRAYIDLIGLDTKSVCHLVEAKIGGDEMLVLQGLDYHIWAMAHQKQLADYFGVKSEMRFALDFVVSAKDGGKAIGRYTAAQAAALDGGIRWQFHEVSEWLNGPPKVSKHRRRTVPGPPTSDKPVASPRFAQRIHKHLVAVAIRLKSDGVSSANLDDHIFPEARWAWDSIDKRELLHRYATHVRSSQAFAVNLFGPLDDNAVARLLGDVFGPVTSVERPYFEFEDTADRLREARNGHPHRTQVDVVLRGANTTGQPVALLIEVKLAEEDFGHCSAFTNPINDTRHNCHQSGPFGADVESCFQLRIYPDGERRLYDHYLPKFEKPSGTDVSGCWYRTSASQPMRNVALVGVLRDDGIDARYALCAPAAHREIWRRWDDVHHVLPNELLVTLSAETVLALHGQSTHSLARDRYQLGSSQSTNTTNNT